MIEPTLQNSQYKEIVKSDLYEEQDGKFIGCLDRFPMRNFEIDHVHPQSMGGGDEKFNLQLLCSACNRSKSASSQEKFLEKTAHLRKGKIRRRYDD